MGVCFGMCSMFLTIIVLLAISVYGAAGVVTLQSANPEHSDYNVEFNVADLVQIIQTPHGEVEIHAFKSTKNDEILNESSIPRYSQLIWVSLGNPTFVFQNGTESNSGRGLFRESGDGFYGFVQMLTSKHRVLLADKAKFRYNINVDESQIVNLVLSTFECSLYLHDQSGSEYQIKGIVNNFQNFPLRINFRLSPNGPEGKLFAHAINQSYVDHVFMCKMGTKGRKTLRNTLRITSGMSEQIGLESKLFGPVEHRADQVFITRQQSAALSRELYSALVIREEYDMPQNKFEEAFIQGLVSQAAAQSFQFQPIDTVLASLSKYGTYDVTADLKPDVIKRDLGSILKVETHDEKSRIVLDAEKVSKVGNKFVLNGGYSASASFLDIVDGSASINFGIENDYSKHTIDRSLDDQLRELNAASQNEIRWEIEGEKVVPKSVNVSRLIRSKFSQTLEFSRISATHEEAAFVRRIGLSTMHAEKSAIHTAVDDSLKSGLNEFNGTLQLFKETVQQFRLHSRQISEEKSAIHTAVGDSLKSGLKEFNGTLQLFKETVQPLRLHSRPISEATCNPLLIQQNVQNVDGSNFFDRTWEEFKAGFGSNNGNYWLGNELLHQLTMKNTYKLRFDLQSRENAQWFWAEYSTFTVSSETTGYKLHVGGFSGNVHSDALRRQNGMKFTTKDRDNDMHGVNCAQRNIGGFWYKDCADCGVNSGSSFYYDWEFLTPGYSYIRTSRMSLVCR